jgi:hypothetical protein
MNDPQSARTADLLAIHDTLARYSRAIDRQELALLHEVFHANARIDNGHFNGSPADFTGPWCASAIRASRRPRT